MINVKAVLLEEHMVCGVTVEANDLYDVKHKWHRNEM